MADLFVEARPMTDADVEPAVEAEAAAPAPQAAPEADEKQRPTRRRPDADVGQPVVPVVSSTGPEEQAVEERPKKAGWWQRRSFF